MYTRFHQLDQPQLWERKFQAGERFYVDMENDLSLGKKNISCALHANNNVWSTLLQKRMNTIDSMSEIIGERYKVIYAQKDLIDQHHNTIHHQGQLISE